MSETLVWSSEEIEYEEDLMVIDDNIGYLGEKLREYVLNSIGSEDYLLINANNINWRGSSGYKKISLWDKSDLELGREVLPKSECNFKLYLDGNKLYAVVSSHDVPTGGIWNMVPMIDIEEELGLIYEECIEETFDDLAKAFDKIGMDIRKWKEEDVTSDFIGSENYYKVTMLGDSLTIFWTSVIDKPDSICEIEWNEEDIENEYLKSIM